MERTIELEELLPLLEEKENAIIYARPILNFIIYKKFIEKGIDVDPFEKVIVPLIIAGFPSQHKGRGKYSEQTCLTIIGGLEKRKLEGEIGYCPAYGLFIMEKLPFLKRIFSKRICEWENEEVRGKYHLPCPLKDYKFSTNHEEVLESILKMTKEKSGIDFQPYIKKISKKVGGIIEEIEKEMNNTSNNASIDMFF